MSIITSAKKIINRVQGKSSYTFREHSYNEPPPAPDLSPMEYAVKQWFAEEKYRSAQFEYMNLGHSQGKTEHSYVTRLPGFNESMPFRFKLAVLTTPGCAELDYLKLDLNGGAFAAGFLANQEADLYVLVLNPEGQGIEGSPWEKAAARMGEVNCGGLYLDRAGCLQFRIDPRRFEFWVATQVFA